MPVPSDVGVTPCGLGGLEGRSTLDQGVNSEPLDLSLDHLFSKLMNICLLAVRISVSFLFFKHLFAIHSTLGSSPLKDIIGG